jgi:hypothetical protein
MVWVARFPDHLKSVSELGDDFVPEPLGIYDDVLNQLRRLLPNAKIVDRTFITVPTMEVAEIYISNVQDGIVTSMSFLEPTARFLVQVYTDYKWRVADPSNGRIIPPFEPTDNYRLPPDLINF